TQAVDTDQLLEIDRYAMVMTSRMQDEITRLYERYEFHPAVARLQTFCSEDLGSFYLDILKDRLYTSAADSLARRSAQTALWHVTQTLLRLMAPILSFTAEEAWALLPHDDEAASQTIFTQLYHEVPLSADAQVLAGKWERLRNLRADVLRKLEETRSAGGIGSSLQAEVDLYASGEDLALLQSLDDDLRFVLIVSRATVHAADGDLRIEVAPSTHDKCERCWHWRADIGSSAEHPHLCGRCVSNLFGSGESRLAA